MAQGTQAVTYTAQIVCCEAWWLPSNKQNVSAKCRMCGEGDETVRHIVSECKKLAQKQYRCWRHDKVVTLWKAGL